MQPYRCSRVWGNQAARSNSLYLNKESSHPPVCKKRHAACFNRQGVPAKGDGGLCRNPAQ
ncbi:hypothetical protein E5357_14755 [Hominisplanchenecus murintestinalis]|uniref:Uncharacterized protein n=1 Tax=Hominisplanchenecus murintestinalis TaxID=2941517 RepID=A0AC61QW59_9FIRM|nr:hypothetical protein E5357_14755 [Hominisplanchenecus murintestinalis]